MQSGGSLHPRGVSVTIGLRSGRRLPAPRLLTRGVPVPAHPAFRAAGEGDLRIAVENPAAAALPLDRALPLLRAVADDPCGTRLTGPLGVGGSRPGDADRLGLSRPGPSG